MIYLSSILVDEAYGFDNYIMKTEVNEIYAWKLLKLKREMLLKLVDKDNFAGIYLYFKQ